MSKIGRKPIPLNGVKVIISENSVVCEGKLGKKQRSFDAKYMCLEEKDGYLYIKRTDVEVADNNRKLLKQIKERWGLTRSLIANDIIGVRDGFKDTVIIKGVGYSITSTSEKEIEIKIGYSHPVVLSVLDGLKIEIKGTRCTIHSTDKETLGKFIGKMLSIKRYNVYNNTGIRKESEQKRLKAGKSGKK